MEVITEIISANLQAIRRERQLTLQDLADLTGVSKSMLGEIERGTSNPTITVLWKIITGLKISISQLIHEPSADCRLVTEKDWRTLRAHPADISMIFECDHSRNFEVYHMEFQPKATYASDSHDRGMMEYMMVYEGRFTITVNKKSFELGRGDSLLFEADAPHAYVNNGAETAKAYSLIHYPKSL